jgi:hypothetical protein
MLAPAQRQHKIQRLGLGARLRIGYADQRKTRIAEPLPHRSNRALGQSFDGKFDV